MAGLPRAALAAAGALLAAARGVAAEPTAEVGRCDFDVEPSFPGYFWDGSCELGQPGCKADGKNVECRFCGGGDYSVPCPPSSCHFPNDPFVPYYWDPDCEMGMLGCWADGIHRQCRFCGEHPFTGISCPAELSAPPNGAECTFENEPLTPYYWDPGCEMGVHGCNADGAHVQCRFCGKDVYRDIPCPAGEVCSFAAEPTIPYFWDPDCAMGKLGCMADGMHAECRFCGKRPFESIECPGPIEPPKMQCTFPLHGEPQMGYFWDESCENGMLGCWADGMHAECRFCGGGVFEEIGCPMRVVAEASGGDAAEKVLELRYDAGTASRTYMRETRLQTSAVAKDMKASASGEEEEWLNGAPRTAGLAVGALASLLLSFAARGA